MPAYPSRTPRTTTNVTASQRQNIQSHSNNAEHERWNARMNARKHGIGQAKVCETTSTVPDITERPAQNARIAKSGEARRSRLASARVGPGPGSEPAPLRRGQQRRGRHGLQAGVLRQTCPGRIVVTLAPGEALRSLVPQRPWWGTLSLYVPASLLVSGFAHFIAHCSVRSFHDCSRPSGLSKVLIQPSMRYPQSRSPRQAGGT